MKKITKTLAGHLIQLFLGTLHRATH